MKCSRFSLQRVGTAVILSVGLGVQWAQGTAPSVSPASPAAEAAEQLNEILVEAPEPRYVAPTRRDQIGRIWAPVFINGKGPFRLVLDTGASHSAVTAMVALALGIPTDQSPPVMLRGVTGSATVPTIRVDSLTVGDVSVDSPLLPIVPDAMGGAQGVLGSEGLTNKRIVIDFKHDKISIAFSRDEKPERGFVNIPFHSVAWPVDHLRCLRRRRAGQGHHRYRGADHDRQSGAARCPVAYVSPYQGQT